MRDDELSWGDGARQFELRKSQGLFTGLDTTEMRLIAMPPRVHAIIGSLVIGWFWSGAGELAILVAFGETVPSWTPAVRTGRIWSFATSEGAYGTLVHNLEQMMAIMASLRRSDGS